MTDNVINFLPVLEINWFTYAKALINAALRSPRLNNVRRYFYAYTLSWCTVISTDRIARDVKEENTVINSVAKEIPTPVCSRLRFRWSLKESDETEWRVNELSVLKSRLKPALPTWPHSEPLNVTRALRDIDLMRPAASVLRIYAFITQNSI